MSQKVSIILPTYNRADVLPRAIRSVLQQTIKDFELLVVDDGSTDNTATVVKELGDGRIRYIYQSNGGCYQARNAGLAMARGKYVTFLDSDDVWLPHYLSLTIGFLQLSGAPYVMTEFLTDDGRGERSQQDRDTIRKKFVPMARRIGSSSLQLPNGKSDPYLRIYDEVQPLADYLRDDDATRTWPDAKVYSGSIYDYFRWGHLGWLPTTVIRRDILAAVGNFDGTQLTGADYLFLAALAKYDKAHMIAVPCAIKYEFGEDNAALAEAHLATGVNEYRFAVQRITFFRRLFSDEADVELMRICALYESYAGRVALSAGDRQNAMKHFRRARDTGVSSAGYRLASTVASMVPNGPAAGICYRALRKACDFIGVRI